MLRTGRIRVPLWTLLFLLNPSHPYPAPWCPPSQRYDVRRFPPRCLDCPKIVNNRMHVSVISTRVWQRQQPAKFSPGLPHNQTCGCWRAGNQAAFDVSLNASWVVSGLSLSASRHRWLRRFSVAASGDNQTFLDWGTYTQGNFSSATIVLFRYPIRAMFFRITVLEYVNHLINATGGFPVVVNALVSDSEPFGCECATLASGECCPKANMEVKNDTCVTCMDHSDIHTVVVDGCARCKPGTSPVGLRCVPVVPLTFEEERRVDIIPDGWSLGVDVAPSSAAIVLFLGGDRLPFDIVPLAACLAVLSKGNFTPVLWDVELSAGLDYGAVQQTKRAINQQYLQFDRGRLALNMTEDNIRSWAVCDGYRCTGSLGALFIDFFSNLCHVMQHPLVFELDPPSDSKTMVCSFSQRPIPPTSVEIHHLLDTDRYVLHLTPPLVASAVQWDDDPNAVMVDSDGIMAVPPPVEWFSMRVFVGSQTLSVRPPVPILRKNQQLRMQRAKEATWVRIAYGLGLRPTPEPGDSEQLTTISAVSKQPMRLISLVSVAGGVTTVYTTTKGFISDSKRALDLVVACNGMMDADAMVAWLESALGMLGNSMLKPFAQLACNRVHTEEVSKLYWLVPRRPAGTGRREKVDVRVEVDFV